jgi:hypothetical protein
MDIGNQIDAAMIFARPDFVDDGMAHGVVICSNLAEARLNREPIKDLLK